MLRVQDLRAGYGDLQVLFDLSLEVPERCIVGVVGPNGAGKSTFMLAIAGVLRPRGGRIMLHGDRLEALSAPQIVRRGVVLCPQGRLIFPQMTVLENLRLGAFVNRRSPDLSTWLEKVFDYFPVLAARAGQIASSLSGGEQQMLAIGRAMMTRPRLLLLDEPSTGLAPAIVELVAETLRRLVREDGISVLLVEQNVELALGVSEALYMIEHGQARFCGTRDQFTADEEIARRYFEA
jgi:branched-chain amino acid transport system ATP-binding protein